ncbi:MAG TPA: hypothetical protein VI854_04495, partial [Acidimicrobiia bacterium]|nr:hypothetical protein [Acidimicrobiia bacterium]
GSELLVWGGDPEGDGAAYDPQRDRWRPVPPAPFPPRVFPASAWTGFELIVWGGRPGGGAASLATGAAYEPVTRRWRRLPPAPLGPRTPLAGIWTGEELVVVGGAGERQERLTDAAAYHPQLDRWRPIAPLPVPLDEAVGLWTGREVVVVGDRVAAWDPRADRWRELPAAPLATGALTAVWTGEHVLAWDFELHAAALDVAREGAWRRLPDLPLDFRDCEPAGVLAGDVVFAEHCGQGAVYHPALREWRRVPHPRELSATPRWTGRELVFWVGNFAGSHDGVWRFRPPGRRPRGPVPP